MIAHYPSQSLQVFQLFKVSLTFNLFVIHVPIYNYKTCICIVYLNLQLINGFLNTNCERFRNFVMFTHPQSTHIISPLCWFAHIYYCTIIVRPNTMVHFSFIDITRREISVNFLAICFVLFETHKKVIKFA